MIQATSKLYPACLPGRAHSSTVTDIGVPFAPRVTSTCEICGETWQYDVQTIEQANHTYHKIIRRPPKPETWKVVETTAHIQRTNRSER